MIPTARPKQKKEATLELLRKHRVSDPVCLVGVRGYYSKMGKTPHNERNLYDDALILIAGGGDTYATFNANVDPSAYGKNPKINKPYAVLKPGVWTYKLGKHGIRRGNPYKALVQGTPVTVLRDDEEETGWFGINIHRGGLKTTSSEGCQTLPPQQWDAFIALVESEMKRNNAKTLSYVLTSNS
jgi:lysozyme